MVFVLLFIATPLVVTTLSIWRSWRGALILVPLFGLLLGVLEIGRWRDLLSILSAVGALLATVLHIHALGAGIRPCSAPGPRVPDAASFAIGPRR